MNMSEKVHASFMEKVLKGEAYHTLPLGYKHIGPKNQTCYPNGTKQKRIYITRPVVVDKDKAEIIKEVYRAYIGGRRRYDLLEYINNKFSTKFTKSGLYGFLNNHFYYGMLQYKGKLYPHKYEPIIDEKTFMLAQNLLSQNNRKKTNTLPKKSDKEHKSVKIKEDPLLSFCLYNGKTLEEIMEFTQLPLSEAQQRLTDLELDGKIEELHGQWKTVIG